MAILHRKNNKKDDPENGDPEGEEAREKEDRSHAYDNGDEYEILLRFAQDEAKKLDSKKDDSSDDDDKVEMRRQWYPPFKKVRVGEEKDKQIPQDWLGTDLKGLPSGEIDGRRSGFGYNELESPKENQFLKFLSYFRGPILYMMEVAVVLAAGLQDWIDFGVIIGILMGNAFVGWYQEKQAGDIVAQLKAGIAMKAWVIRDSKEQEIEARELVIGDIVILEEGSTIPADCKILCSYEDREKGRPKEEKKESPKKKQHQDNGSDSDHHDSDDDEDAQEDKGPSLCAVDQSAITGESLAVDKYVSEIAFYTCQIKRGKCLGVVACPAKQSFVGKTASLVTNSNETGHFQIVLGGIGTALLVIVFFFIFAVWIGGFFRGINISTPKENNLLIYALIFFIIGVPVGLPVVTTTTMAVGASFLASKKAIVQKLTAIESLAGVDMLCTDKTGTLTANKLSLNDPWCCKDVDKDWLMTVGVLASSHNVKSLDPIDKVTIIGLKDFPGAQENLKSGWKTTKFSPFNPVNKLIQAEVEKEGKKYTVCKGAANAILKLQNFPAETVDEFRSKSKEFAQRGFKSLGIAVKEGSGEWQLLGLLSMSDPPRGDTRSTIADAIELGVSIKMLTGDAVAIAIEVCKQLGLGVNVYDSEKLIGGSLTGSEVHDFIEAADGFAEVFPEHKYKVVQMLQQRGHLTAMTGDGVNDAPSLKKADCGIAVEGASDAARSAADVVFLDEGLSTMILAIKTARQIFHRMKAYIVYRIALCIHLEVYLMLSMIILNETIRADLIVFLALFADVGTLAIAYDNAPFARKPVEWQLPKVWIISTIMGLLLAAGTWIVRGTLFLPSGGVTQNFGSTQEILFLEVALTESWVIFITRLSIGPESGGFVWPSWQLVGAVFLVDALATLFTIFGWIGGAASAGGGHTSVVTVVKIWCYCFGVTIVVAFAYFLLNKIPFLDNLGRKSRHSKNTKLENFITDMQKMTLVHEQDSHGQDIFRFSSGQGETSSASSGKASGGTESKKDDKKDDKKDEKKEDNKAKNKKDDGDDHEDDTHSEKKVEG